jgi:hypothetical protein
VSGPFSRAKYKSMENEFMEVFFIIASFVSLFAVMAILIFWARSRSSGVLAVGAFFSILAPDPTLEQKIVMVEEAKVDQNEQDEQDEP